MCTRVRSLLPLAALTVAAGAWTSAAGQIEARDTATGAAPAPGSAAAAAPAATPVAITFKLVQVGGQALPVEVEKGWRCREEVTAGALTLGAEGRWMLETTKRETCGDRTKDEIDTDEGRFTTEGQTYSFFDEDGEQSSKEWSLGKDIDVDDFITGSLAGDGTLEVRLADEKTTLTFRR
jgi:hypothetical protein